MSGKGFRILVLDCPLCGNSDPLPFSDYFVGEDVHCDVCHGLVRLTYPNARQWFLFGKSAIPYWVNIEFEDSPPRRTQEAPKRSSGGAGSSKKGKAKLSNSSSTNNNGNLKAKPSNSSTKNGKLSSTPSQTQTNADEIDDQDTEDENFEDDDQKPSIVVNGNQVSGNTGDKNGGFSVGHTTFRARKFVVIH